jgi:hypothetical protein
MNNKEFQEKWNRDVQTWEDSFRMMWNAQCTKDGSSFAGCHSTNIIVETGMTESDALLNLDRKLTKLNMKEVYVEVNEDLYEETHKGVFEKINMSIYRKIKI